MRPSARSTLFVLGFIWLITSAGTTQAGLLLERANQLYKAGEISKAINAYRQAAIGGENPALCYFNMANAYFTMDSLPESILYYRLCTGYAPDFFRAHLNLAVTYYTLQDYGAAIASLRRALSIDPQHLKAQLILATSYRELQSYPEAIATFEQIAEQDEQNHEAILALAEMYRELGDEQEAISWLQRYPQTAPNGAYASIVLADIYENRGELEQAFYFLQKSYAEDSSNRWVFYRMVLLQKQMGNPLVALELAQQGLEVLREFTDLLLVAGNLAFDAGKLEQARHYYQRARQQGSASAVVGLENIRLIQKNSEL